MFLDLWDLMSDHARNVLLQLAASLVRVRRGENDPTVVAARQMLEDDERRLEEEERRRHAERRSSRRQQRAQVVQ